MPSAREKMLNRIEAGCYCAAITKDGWACARAPVDTVSGRCHIHAQRSDRKSDKQSTSHELMIKAMRKYLPVHEIERLERLIGQAPSDSLFEAVVNARMVVERINVRNGLGLYTAETYARELRAAANHLAKMEETLLRVRQLQNELLDDDADDPDHTFDPASEDPNNWPDR